MLIVLTILSIIIFLFFVFKGSNSFPPILISGLTTFMLLFAVILRTGYNNKTENIANRWNNGYCDCGTQYVLFNIVGHSKFFKKDKTSYIYICNNCGHTVEFDFPIK